MGFGVVWTVVKGLAQVVPHVLDFLAHRRVEKKAKAMQAKIDQAKRPDKSIEETANAAKELQREIDPHSDFDSSL